MFVEVQVEQTRRPSWLKACMLVIAFIILTAPRVLAEPAPEPIPMPTTHLFLRTGDGVLRGPDGKDYLIPQESRILTKERWSELDVEMMRLTEAETRLTAENKSLRKSADSFNWLPVAIGAGVGIVLGAYVGTKLSK